MRDWESVFAGWANGPGKAEEERIENAIRAVKGALSSDPKLRATSIVFLQGSYRNKVNVRADSDVDIGVLFTGGAFYGSYPPGSTAADFGFLPADYSYAEFKNDVGQALSSHLGAPAVTRGNKAFDVHENSYRVDADVVPVFEHRRYSAAGQHICGVVLFPDRGGEIVNWPERLKDLPTWPRQHYENGLARHQASNRSYRRVVRILKKLRNELDEAGSAAAKKLCGFTVECLVWNVPVERLSARTWDATVQTVLSYLWTATRNPEECKEWGEVSELKYLFTGESGRTPAEAHAFVNAAWDYVGVRAK